MDIFLRHREEFAKYDFLLFQYSFFRFFVEKLFDSLLIPNNVIKYSHNLMVNLEGIIIIVIMYHSMTLDR